MRAYRSQRDKLEGYEDGTFDGAFYYIMPNKTYEYRHYAAMSPPLYTREFPGELLLFAFATSFPKYKQYNANDNHREFPAGWKNMDMGIGEPINVY